MKSNVLSLKYVLPLPVIGRAENGRKIPPKVALNSKPYCVLYHSQIAPSAPISCVADIVKTARGFNKDHDITGILVFDGQRFFQYLEGPKEAVMGLVVRIAQDSRHVQFRLQHQGPCAEERMFRNWSMAYVLVDDSEPLADLHGIEGESAMNKLKSLMPLLDIA